MKVRELIEQLQRVDPDVEVMGSDCCYGLSSLTSVERDAVLTETRTVKGVPEPRLGSSSVEHRIDYDGEWWDDDHEPVVQVVVLH